MSYYGAGQAGNPGVPNQAQMVRTAASLQPQLFGQLQFQPGSQQNPFENNHILLQSQGAPGFQNLNVSFLSEQLAAAGVNQILSQATSNASNMQSLMSPMAMTSLSFPAVPSANVAQPGGAGQKQRVFTGTVTKAHADFGFIDDEVFFTTAAVKGPILPKAGDRVLVEAEFNGSAAFKWTATRIQIVNIGGGLNKNNSSQNSQQQSYQPNVSAAEKTLQANRAMQNQLVAPPPPIISLTSQAGVTSSRHTTSTSSDGMNYSHVSIISNPHSVYSHSSSQQMQQNAPSPSPIVSVAAYQQAQAQRVLQSPVRGLIPMGVGVPMGVGGVALNPMQFHNHNAQIPSLFNAPEMNSNAATMEILRKNEKERDRMENSNSNNRERERDRERERERDKEREQREKSRRDREKDKSREVEKERERERERVDRVSRRRSPSPPPKKARTEVSDKQPSRGEKDKDKAKDGDSRVSRVLDRSERSTHNASPASSSASASVSRKRSRSRSRQRVGDKEKEASSNPRRDRERDRATSPRRRTKSRSRSTSQKPIVRYNVVVPQYPLETMELSVTELKRRYQRLYIPSDFFMARACWLETFPLSNPLDLTKTSPVVVYRKHAEPIELGYIDYDCNTLKKSTRKLDLIPEPEDARRLFSAKVMLLSNPGEPKIYNTNVRRVINFIVGLKMGKSDLQAIGGSWSAALDGINPQSDPDVLIRTAIRTTKTSVGIDLSTCKRWYRFMELYYRRTNGVLETVVFFIPDLSSCVPTEGEWKRTVAAYRIALGEARKEKTEAEKSASPPAAAVVDTTVPAESNLLDSIPAGGEKGDGVQTMEVVATEETDVKPTLDTDSAEVDVNETTAPSLAEATTMEIDSQSEAAVVVKNEAVDKDGVKEADSELNSSSLNADEKESSANASSQLDPKLLNVAKLREELSLRGLNTKGLKAQLQSRLMEAIEGEKTASAEAQDEAASEQNVISDDGHESAMDVTVKAEPEIEESKPEVTHTHLTETKTETCEKAASQQEGEEVEESVQDVEQHSATPLPEVLVPLIPEDADEKTKETWKRRYSLPKTPHFIVHPLQTGRTQEFDCSKMCLASIREYRVHDVKEQSFEVNLFSEFFNEMLARDFAHKIYSETVVRTQLPPAAEGDKKGKDEKKEKCMDEKEKDKKENKEEKTKDSKSGDAKKATKEKEVKKDDAGKQKESSADENEVQKLSRPATATKTVPDNILLLAFTFFDSSRCGYLKEIDFEEICLISGLNLTRAQVRKVTQKVFEKESQFRYNLWTDNQLCAALQEEILRSVPSIKSDNSNLLPVFVYQKTLDCPNESKPESAEGSVLVPFNGQLIDIGKLQEQNKKYEAEFGILEANINALKNNLVDAQLQATDFKRSSEGWKAEYLKVKETSKTSETLLKTQADDLETFRRASERFFDRVKGVIDVKGGNQGTSGSKDKSSSSTPSKPDSDVKVEVKN